MRFLSCTATVAAAVCSLGLAAVTPSAFATFSEVERDFPAIAQSYSFEPAFSRPTAVVDETASNALIASDGSGFYAIAAEGLDQGWFVEGLDQLHD